MSTTLLMPISAPAVAPPAPSPLDTLHLSLSSALPRVRPRVRRASSYTSPTGTPRPPTPLAAPREYHDLPQEYRPHAPRTVSSPILPHARSNTDPPQPGYGMRPLPTRLHPLAMAHIGRIAESAELLMRHLQAQLARRTARSAPSSSDQDGALQLSLGPVRARDELVGVHIDRASLIKSLATFRSHVDSTKRSRHYGNGKRGGGIHAAGSRRTFVPGKLSGSGRGGGVWRPRRGAVVSLGGAGRARGGEGEENSAWVEDVSELSTLRTGEEDEEMEMEVDELEERMGEFNLHD